MFDIIIIIIHHYCTVHLFDAIVNVTIIIIIIIVAMFLICEMNS